VAALKLHAAVDHDGYLPSFVHVTEGNVHESKIAPRLAVENNSIVVFDRGFNDFGWFNALNKKGIWFVTRLKSNAKYRVMERRLVQYA
jgi:putative transposase